MGYIPQVILAGRSINDGMGSFVANQVVKALIKNDVNVKSSIVTILGLTFKEDVPDLRNTRVTDIIDELKSYELEVQIHDPMASTEEAMEEYGLNIVPQVDLKLADALILAVPHKLFLTGSWPELTTLLKDEKG